MIAIYAEKPDIGAKLAAILGKCFINGTEQLNMKNIYDADFHNKLETYQKEYGYLKCIFEDKDYCITWGKGHIATLKNAKDYDSAYKVWKEELFPFIPEHFQIKVIGSEAIKRQCEIIKRLFNDVNTKYIINATDSDREGQLIFDWVRSLTKTKKPCMRLWLNSYTEEEVIKAMHNLKPEEEYLNLTKAARCRAVSDWEIGTNLTAVATLKYGNSNNVFSIGRVQTVVLYMIVQRELSIKEFRPQTYYEIEAVCNCNDKKFNAVWENSDGNKIYDKKEAEQILESVKGKTGKVLKYSSDDYYKHPPLLYDLTELQRDANIKYKLTAKETLDTAQSLYQKQFISYPRTNSRYLPKSKQSEIKRIIQNLPGVYDKFKNKVLNNIALKNSRIFDDSKVDSHYALIPTYLTPDENLNEREIMIYGLIARSLIKVFMADMVYKRNNIIAQFNEQKFVSKNSKLIENGWKEAEKTQNVCIDPDEDIEDKEYKNINEIVEVNKNDTVTIDNIYIKEKSTRHPARYTDSSILNAMKTCGKRVTSEKAKEEMKNKGIGTAATRAEIIEKLIKVGYVIRADDKYLMPTPKAIKLIEKIPIEEIKSPDLTGEWEYKLNLVAEGKLPAKEFAEVVKKDAVDMTEKLKLQKREYLGGNALGLCPEDNCDGKIIEGRRGYGCTNYIKGCKFVIWKEMYGVKITPALVQLLLTKGITGKLTCKKKDGETYVARLKRIKGDDGKQKIIPVK